MHASSSAGDPAFEDRAVSAAPSAAPSAARLSVRLTRAPILVLAAVAMAAGLTGGLARLGLDLPGLLPPGPAADLTLHHGPLMVAALFGTVIGLERAVAAGGRWPFLAPVASGLGGVLLVAGAPPVLAAGTIAAAGVILLAGALAMARLHPALHTAVMAGGCACWLAGNLLWLGGNLLGGWPVTHAVPWWTGFLVLVIAGERLELSRVLKPPPGRTALFLAAAGLLLGGIAAASVDDSGSLAPMGPGLLAMALWLVRYDVARRTVRQSGLVRYVAVCLLGGYLWLGAAGLLALAEPMLAEPMLFARDAALHGVFLGFVLTMVFAHAPIILPALLKIAVPYSPAFYTHVAILHATLALRTLADLLGWVDVRACAGLGNAAAIAVFAVLTATAAVRARPASAGPPDHRRRTGAASADTASSTRTRSSMR